jgi:hypothetical protein
VALADPVFGIDDASCHVVGIRTDDQNLERYHVFHGDVQLGGERGTLIVSKQRRSETVASSRSKPVRRDVALYAVPPSDHLECRLGERALDALPR